MLGKQGRAVRWHSACWGLVPTWTIGFSQDVFLVLGTRKTLASPTQAPPLVP